MIGTFVRGLVLDWLQHGLTVLGAGFVSNGLITASQNQQAIGALMTIVGIGWSAADEYAEARLRQKAP